MIQQAIIEVYPIISKGDTIQIWERKGYEYATPEAKGKYIQLKMKGRNTTGHT